MSELGYRKDGKMQPWLSRVLDAVNVLRMRNDDPSAYKVACIADVAFGSAKVGLSILRASGLNVPRYVPTNAPKETT